MAEYWFDTTCFAPQALAHREPDCRKEAESEAGGRLTVGAIETAVAEGAEGEKATEVAELAAAMASMVAAEEAALVILDLILSAIEPSSTLRDQLQAWDVTELPPLPDEFA